MIETKMSGLVDENRALKEKIRELSNKLDQEDKASRLKQEQMVKLQGLCRSLEEKLKTNDASRAEKNPKPEEKDKNLPTSPKNQDEVTQKLNQALTAKNLAEQTIRKLKNELKGLTTELEASKAIVSEKDNDIRKLKGLMANMQAQLAARPPLPPKKDSVISVPAAVTSTKSPMKSELKSPTNAPPAELFKAEEAATQQTQPTIAIETSKVDKLEEKETTANIEVAKVNDSEAPIAAKVIDSEAKDSATEEPLNETENGDENKEEFKSELNIESKEETKLTDTAAEHEDDYSAETF